MRLSRGGKGNLFGDGGQVQAVHIVRDHRQGISQSHGAVIPDTAFHPASGFALRDTDGSGISGDTDGLSFNSARGSTGDNLIMKKLIIDTIINSGIV